MSDPCGPTEQENKAFSALPDVENDLGELREKFEQAIYDAVAKETNRCLAWLRTSKRVQQSIIDAIEHYDEPPKPNTEEP